MSNAHSILPPSGADVWVNCPGSVMMQQQYPERPDNVRGMEGTAAHEVMAGLIRATPVPVGSLASNGIAVTQEMVESAELFCDVFPAELSQPGGVLQAEKRISCPSIHPECWGTLDASALCRNTLRIADLKFGHMFVNEYENYQLVTYASGELDALQFDWAGTSGDLAVELTIVQPRCYSGGGAVRTWRTSALALKPYIERLRAAAAEALDPSPRVCTGEWCNFCTAIHACPAAQRAVSTAIGITYQALPSPMTPDALGLMLRRVQDAADMIKAMRGGLEEEAEALIRSGVTVPGFSLAQGKGKTDWVKPIDEIVALGDMFGVDLRKAGVKTPLQSMKLLSSAGIDDSVISGYSDRVSGGLQLVQTDMSQLRRVFS